MDHQKQAMTYFQAGRNCCQAVVGAYCTELGITEEKANELAAGFGGGNYQGLCGALAGTYIVANYLKGSPELNDPAKCKDDEAGRRMVEMTQDFEGACGSLYCIKLLGKRPCSDYVWAAIKIIDENVAE